MSSAYPTTPTARDWTTKLGIKAYRYRALLKKRWWIVAVAVSIGLLCEAWILVTQPVRFESNGKLIVGGSVEGGDGKFHEVEDGFYTTQTKIIQSDTIKNRALQNMALKSPQLKGSVDILATLEPRTNIFKVAGRGDTQEYTQHYVDAVMEEYIKYKAESVSFVGEQAMQALMKQIKEKQDDLMQQQKDLQVFSEENNMPMWTQSLNATMERLTDLRKQQAGKQNELNQLQTFNPEQILNRPSSPGAGIKPAPEDSSSSGGASPTDLGIKYQQAVQDLAQRKADLEEKSKVWKPEHPGIKKIKDDIFRIQLLLNTIKSQTADSTKVRISTLQSELKLLEDDIAAANKKVVEASRKQGEYDMRKSAVDNTQLLINKLTESMGKTHEATAGPGSISIMEGATPATQVPPGVVKHLVIGLFLGLVAGCIVLYLFDRADDRISSSTEMIEHFSESILGQIPNVDESRVDAGLPLLQKEDERYTFAESFRSLRSSLIFMPNQGELKTLIVTSSIPGEGKSTITSNLAITMALAGARVLVVDADLRRGDLASLFDVDGRVGLSSVLRGEVKWQDAVKKTHHPTLTLLPRGPVTNQSGELLLLPTFEPMMDEFKANFDLVIFNTSPILATDDTPTIAPNFDGTLMVIRAQFTGARLVHNSLNVLYQRQVNVLGLILNCVDTEMPDYYYYRYPKYYAV